jgi:hypothetical protein
MGLIKGAFKILIYGGVITSLTLGGIYGYNHYLKPPSYGSELNRIEAREEYYQNPSQLEIKIIDINGEEIPFLVDNKSGIKQPILKDFQLGNASYRLKGLFNEGADPVLSAGKDLVNWLKRSD